MTIVTHPHPSWCDPRACCAHHAAVEHAEAPITWTAGDHRFSVGMSRYDEITPSAGPTPGAQRVTLNVEDIGSLGPSGEVLFVEVDLTGVDVQLLAAALLSADRRLTLAASTGSAS